MSLVSLDPEELWLVKTDDWSSEQEQRMARLLRDTEDTGSTDANGHRVFVTVVPAAAIVGVVFGLRTTRGDRAAFSEVLGGPDYAHARLMEVDLDAAKSALVLTAAS